MQDVLDPDDRQPVGAQRVDQARPGSAVPPRSARRRSRRAAARAAAWPARAPVRAACGRGGRAARPGRFARRISPVRSSTSRRHTPRLRRRQGPRRFAQPTSTFSNTVMPRNGRGTWYVRAMPDRQRAAASRRGDFGAIEPNRAGLGGNVPARTPNKRRLAGAVGADNANRLAGRDTEIDAFERPESAEALVDRMCLEQWGHGVGRCALPRPRLVAPKRAFGATAAGASGQFVGLQLTVIGTSRHRHVRRHSSVNGNLAPVGRS